MTTIESEIIPIPKKQEEIFLFLSDFTNFEKLMPSTVTNWSATTTTCSFTISGMAQVALKIESNTPHSKINIISTDEGKLPFSFTLGILLQIIEENSCTGQLIFKGEIPIFIKPMLLSPLTNFFNSLAHKMKDI